jgi:phage terminase small subunit
MSGLSSQLSDKQDMFCREYLIDLNATQAAIRAGYSERTANEQGSRLLAQVSIKQKIQSLMNDRTERLKIDADYVLSTIVETVERCRQHISPVTYKNGEPSYTATEDGELAHAYQFDSSAVLKGAELLGKHLKMFTDKTEISGPDGSPVAVSVSFVDAKG